MYQVMEEVEHLPVFHLLALALALALTLISAMELTLFLISNAQYYRCE